MPDRMRRFPVPLSRLLLLGVMLAFVVLMAGNSFGQTAAGANPSGGNPGATPTPAGLTQLILGHIDFIFITIAVLSIISLTLIIQSVITTRAAVFMPETTTNQIREMIGSRRFKDLIEFTEADPSFIAKVLNPALKRAPSFAAMKEAMETAIGEQTAEQFRRIEYLNIIGNLGPLLGLLGTVLGMIQAFSAMQAAAGNASPAQLAGGISTALTHTFLGLFLAVPCLAAFGVLRTRVDRLTVRGALVAEELLLMMRPNAANPAPVGSPFTPPAPRLATPQPAVRKPTPSPSPA